MDKKTIISTCLICAVLVGIIALSILYFSGNTGIEKKELTLVLGADVKKEYNLNDEFVQPSVSILSDDDELIDVSDCVETTFSGYNLSRIGAYTVKVKYETKTEIATASYIISVFMAKAESIRATYSESKLLWGESIDKSKLTVKVKYSDKREEVTTDYQLKYNSKPDSYGEINVNVTYKELSCSFKVEVVSKKVDERYTNLEDEAKAILVRLGVANPSCPKDYEFILDAQDVGSIRINGTLQGYSPSNATSLMLYLTGTVFQGYTLVSGPETTTEAVFPSVKIVYSNQTQKTKATIYITSFGEAMYMILLEKI